MTAFKPVTKAKSRLHLALAGPSGSGKTYTALAFAHAIGGRIALIDTEHSTAAKYSGAQADGTVWHWDNLDLQPGEYAPSKYVEAIKAAGAAGYDVLIIDSLSHAWAGSGGALDQVDHARDANKFTAWRYVTPQHNALVEAILGAPCHVIATLRSKMEYVLETDERGKQVPKKIGLKPIQRDGIEYEFDIVGDLDLAHNMTISKTRCPAVDGQIVHRPSGVWIEQVREWLQTGEHVPPSVQPSAFASAPFAAPPAEPLPPGDAEITSRTPIRRAASMPEVEPGPIPIAKPAPSGGNGDIDEAPNRGGVWTPEHKRLADAILALAEGDKEIAAGICERYTEFTAKDGKRVRGVRSVADMKLKRVRATWPRVQKDYEAMLAEDAGARDPVAEADAASCVEDRRPARKAQPADDEAEEIAAIEAGAALDDGLPF